MHTIHPAAPSCPGGHSPAHELCTGNSSPGLFAALPGLIQDTQQQATFSQRKRECKLPVRMTDRCLTFAHLTGLLNCFATSNILQAQLPALAAQEAGVKMDMVGWKAGSGFSLCYRIDSACAKPEISSVLPTWTAESKPEGDAAGF